MSAISRHSATPDADAVNARASHLQLVGAGEAPERASSTFAVAAPAPGAASDVALHRADRAALVSLQEALCDARAHGDQRPAFTIIVESLGELGVELPERRARCGSLEQARQDWLRRLRGAGRSESTLAAYRIAIDDLIAFLERNDCLGDAISEETIVCYLDDYRRQKRPAAASYYRRFMVLRRFFRWFSRRGGAPDPFLELDPPPKPQQEADWLSEEEFARLLEAAGKPIRQRPGLAERDRLVLLTLVTTGLRRSELLALDWGDLDLDGAQPSLLVRTGKGGKPRRQPLPAALARELGRRREILHAGAGEPVFCGLAGKRLAPTILAAIIKRAAKRAGLAKHVTAHTLRHSAATWLRRQTGDARLVAAYLGHADLTTVSRYTHVAPQELHEAAEAIASCAGLDEALSAAETAAIVTPAERSDAGTAEGDGRAPAPSDSKRSPRHAVAAN